MIRSLSRFEVENLEVFGTFRCKMAVFRYQEMSLIFSGVNFIAAPRTCPSAPAGTLCALPKKEDCTGHWGDPGTTSDTDPNQRGFCETPALPPFETAVKKSERSSEVKASLENTQLQSLAT